MLILENWKTFYFKSPFKFSKMKKFSSCLAGILFAVDLIYLVLLCPIGICITRLSGHRTNIIKRPFIFAADTD